MISLMWPHFENNLEIERKYKYFKNQQMLLEDHHIL